MKKLIAHILAASLVLAGSVAARAAGTEETLLARQEEVHQAAELLRELGVPENSDGICALQKEWWRCEQLKNARHRL